MTLIEVMVVMVILGMIATAVGMNVMRNWTEARKREARTRAQTFHNVAITYALEGGEGCPGIDDLRPLLDATRDDKDPWGNDFRITCDDGDDTVHVTSAGPDGSFDTEDDIRI